MASTYRFTKNDLDGFRSKLNAKKKALLTTEQDLEQEGLIDLSAETTDEISHIRTHPADLGSNEFEQELTLHLAEDEIKEVQDIEDALMKTQNETYGICQECADEIPFSRLEALPYTRYCGPCELKLEKRHKDEVHHQQAAPRQ